MSGASENPADTIKLVLGYFHSEWSSEVRSLVIEALSDDPESSGLLHELEANAWGPARAKLIERLTLRYLESDDLHHRIEAAAARVRLLDESLNLALHAEVALGIPSPTIKRRLIKVIGDVTQPYPRVRSVLADFEANSDLGIMGPAFRRALGAVLLTDSDGRRKLSDALARAGAESVVHRCRRGQAEWMAKYVGYKLRDQEAALVAFEELVANPDSDSIADAFIDTVAPLLAVDPMLRLGILQPVGGGMGPVSGTDLDVLEPESGSLVESPQHYAPAPHKEEDRAELERQRQRRWEAEQVSTEVKRQRQRQLEAEQVPGERAPSRADIERLEQQRLEQLLRAQDEYRRERVEQQGAARDVETNLEPVDQPNSGLLGGEGGSGVWQPTPRETDRQEEPDAVETFLNAALNNRGKPLKVGRTYQLAVSFGKPSTANAKQVIVPFPRDDDTLDLEVRVVSSHFDVPPFPQSLRLNRNGKSVGRVIFEVTPLPKDPNVENDSPFWILSVLITVKGNHLQRLDLTYDLAAGASIADVKSYTRGGLTGAQELRERVVTLQIRPMHWGYELIAPHSPHPQPHQILVTPLELDHYVKAIRSALLHSVALPSVAFEMKWNDADNSSLLNELALAGFRLYQALFAGDNATEELLEVGDWLRRTTTSEDVSTLQVVSDGFPVPWPLLYLAERWDASNISWENFIGMQCVVEHLPLTNPMRKSPPPSIGSSPYLPVRVLFNDNIDTEIPTRKPLTEQRQYWDAKRVKLQGRLECLTGETLDHFMSGALARTASDKVLYFYCHATSPSTAPEESKIFFTDEAVTLQQLRDSAPRRDQLLGQPLIFINACESADLTPQFYSGFVPYFLGKGARGVIGTECKVPGFFASEWAKAFFDELFSGKALGRVMLDLRRQFLADYNNPLGLLYAVHCDVDTVVVPGLMPIRQPTG